MLERFISPMNARALLQRVLRAEGVDPAAVTAPELRRCSSALRTGASLFVPPSQLDQAMSAINAICGSDSMAIEACAVELRSELDIGQVRATARRICTSIQANPFATQKVATIVSELARNIIAYAETGSLEIVPQSTRPKRIIVRATDNGPGIPNLEEVFSGRYRSRTGMGKGLLGVKRLADKFEIQSDKQGTLVVAEVVV